VIDDPAAVGLDGRDEELAAQGQQARERALLIRADQPAVAHDIADHNRRDLPRSRHGGPSRCAQISRKTDLRGHLSGAIEQKEGSPRNDRDFAPGQHLLSAIEWRCST
jgi:hypothetical protein